MCEFCFLVRERNMSIESVFIPVPSFLDAFKIVSHMSPGRWCFCKSDRVTLEEYRFGTGSE